MRRWARYDVYPAIFRSLPPVHHGFGWTPISWAERSRQTGLHGGRGDRGGRVPLLPSDQVRGCRCVAGARGRLSEPGEDPLAAARWELREEPCYDSPDWIPLGCYAVDGNRGCGVLNLFLARRAGWVAPTVAGDLEEQQLNAGVGNGIAADPIWAGS